MTTFDFTVSLFCYVVIPVLRRANSLPIRSSDDASGHPPGGHIAVAISPVDIDIFDVAACLFCMLHGVCAYSRIIRALYAHTSAVFKHTAMHHEMDWSTTGCLLSGQSRISGWAKNDYKTPVRQPLIPDTFTVDLSDFR
jgi:hypothetical protein